MAHGDYDCCAVCDDKLYYGGLDAKTKEAICSSCVAALAKRGVIVEDVEALIKWIKEEEVKKLKNILKDVGFHFCYYYNDVDEAVESKGIKPNEKGYIGE